MTTSTELKGIMLGDSGIMLGNVCKGIMLGDSGITAR